MSVCRHAGSDVRDHRPARRCDCFGFSRGCYGATLGLLRRHADACSISRCRSAPASALTCGVNRRGVLMGSRSYDLAGRPRGTGTARASLRSILSPTSAWLAALSTRSMREHGRLRFCNDRRFFLHPHLPDSTLNGWSSASGRQFLMVLEFGLLSPSILNRSVYAPG